MTALSFDVLDVAPAAYAATPILNARLRIAETSGAQIHTLALRCQVRIDPHKRRYDDAEAEGLQDLFGPRERWSSTVRNFLWMHASAMVPGFTGSCEVDLPLPCTYDFEVGAAKYLHALQSKGVPLEFLFSGTVFAKGETGFSVAQVPWDRQAAYDMPVSIWKDLVREHFPNTGWVRLDHETIAALAKFKSDNGMLSLDDAITHLLPKEVTA
ncbi:DUF6084 family protein [Antrihabitans sp. YC2-6]|uniref:DUF6084 family protein n=1 Tax=Antrihabitans sp. YC2-6 TaxID=2799498 RepID=UPI0018F5324C|nr:DUF6084 family protein [Antrihabitans sp. YC2-6]MBJ8348470.1 hypothetical protein [Antrihabitans sp. YC2-6]